MDYGHEQTDKELKKLERRLAHEYKTARDSVEKKIKKHLEQFSDLDAKYAKMVEDGKMSEKAYKQWRQSAMVRTDAWKDLRDTLASDLSHTNEIAMGMINDHAIDCYALNMNYGTYEIENGYHIGTSFSMYDHRTVENLMKDDPQIIPKARVDIPEDKRWNRQKLTSAITQGILTGDSIPDIAKRLGSVADMNAHAAVRNARTYTTAAENKGRIDSYERAQNMGIELEQEWVATLDMRTRSSHRHMDGERVKVGAKFSNKCRYPGDPEGDPAEIYNCRCTLVAALKGYNYQDDRFSRLPKDMTYEEWKGAHETNPEYKVFKSGDDANAYFGQRPERRLRRENREEYDRQRAAYESSQFGAWYDGLTTEEMLSIGNYSGDDYSGINGLLRHQMTKKMIDMWNANESITIEDMISHIEKALNRFELQDPIKVFRTCENDVLENLSLIPGSTFHDDGFGSTSVISEKVASGNIVMEINVPAGKGYGAWINPLSGAQDEEYEFLLQRGSDYKVNKVYQRGEDTVVELDLIGNTKNDYSYATKEEVIDLWKKWGTYDEYNAEKI